MSRQEKMLAVTLLITIIGQIYVARQHNEMNRSRLDLDRLLINLCRPSINVGHR